MAGSPTLRRRRLSRRLKELREERRLTAEYVVTEAKKRGNGRWSKSKLVRAENNEWTRPDVKDVRVLLDIYGITDQDERESYEALARQARQRGWWVSYKDVLGSGVYVGLETEAESMRTYESLVIPGLLQTEDYARAVIRGGGVTDPDEVDRTVEARMLRKEVLHRPGAPDFWAIIDEAALLKIPADTGQLQHLLDVQRSTIGVQVLPNSVGVHPGMNGPFTILKFPEDPDVVYTDNLTGQLFIEEPPEVRRYSVVYDHIHASALSVDESRAFLENLIQSQ